MHAAADVDVELLLRPDELDKRLNVEPMPDWWGVCAGVRRAAAAFRHAAPPAPWRGGGQVRCLMQHPPGRADDGVIGDPRAP